VQEDDKRANVDPVTGRRVLKVVKSPRQVEEVKNKRNLLFCDSEDDSDG
jgi:hypothetical protein